MVIRAHQVQETPIDTEVLQDRTQTRTVTMEIKDQVTQVIQAGRLT